MYFLAMQRPLTTIACAGAITLLAATGIPRLTLRTDGHALAPTDAPEVLVDRALRDEFGLHDLIVVLIQSPRPEGIFHTETLRLLDRLTRRIRLVDGVDPTLVSSIVLEKTDRVQTGSLIFRTFLDPIPELPSEMQRLKDDLTAINLYNGTLVSFDGRSTAIHIGVPPNVDRTRLLQRLNDVVADESTGPERIDVIGAPVAESLLGHHILDDLGLPAAWLKHESQNRDREGAETRRHEGTEARWHEGQRRDAEVVVVDPNRDRKEAASHPNRDRKGAGLLNPNSSQSSFTSHSSRSSNIESLIATPSSLPHTLRTWIAAHIGLVPVAIALMAVILLLVFRDPLAAALPLIEVAAGIVFVFGVMGWCNEPIYLTTTILPVILTATGVTDEIHVFGRFRQLLRENPQTDPLTILHETMGEMCSPVIKSGITTAVGFLSFALSPIRSVSTFGLFTALGMLFCLAWSITVIPAQLAWLARRGYFRTLQNRTVAHQSRERKRPVSSPDPAFQHRDSEEVETHPNREQQRALSPSDDRSRTTTPTQSPTTIAHQLNHSPPYLARLGLFASRHRKLILACTLIACALAPIGMQKLTIQDSWIDGFSPQSDFHRATTAFNDGFHGAHLLHICVGTHEKPKTGDIDQQLVDHRSMTIPWQSWASTDDLVGRWVELRREESPAPTPATNQQTPSGRNATNAWSGRIDSVSKRDEYATLRFRIHDSSPRFAMKLTPGDSVRFELSRRSLLDPTWIDQLAKFEDFLREHRDCAVGGVLGPPEYLATANYMIKARQPDSRRIPDKPEDVKDTWMWYERVRGVQRLRQCVDPTFSRAVVTVFLRNANFSDTARLLDAIKDYQKTNFSPRGIQLSFAGDVAVSQALIRSIVSTQSTSLAGAILGTLIVTTLLGRSLKYGLLSIIPCAFAVLTNTALMGWLGIPFGVATSMFAAMTVGIGDDFAIHLLERCRHRALPIRNHEFSNRDHEFQSRERKRPVSSPDPSFQHRDSEVVETHPNRDRKEAALPNREQQRPLSSPDPAPQPPITDPGSALPPDAIIADAVRVTGSSIMIDALAVALGFGVMMLSLVPANARLGGLLVASLASCLVATLVIMPALIRICWFEPTTVSPESLN